MVAATDLAPRVNAYVLRVGPPKQIIVPRASALAALQEITLSGTLLAKQVIMADLGTGKRTVSLGANGGKYQIEADGDLHFCVGRRVLTPHITCELQHATQWLATFQAAIGTAVSATGWFRCLFEHPGFDANDDAHIFEVHPVRAVTLAGMSQAFDVGLPDPASIHTWTSPHPLNQQDDRIQVTYDRAADTLTFTGMDGQDENYVRVPGDVSNVRRGVGNAPSTFTLTSPDVGRPLEVIAMVGTRADQQLAALTAHSVSLVGLRNIDLNAALAGRYVINLLAIDIQPGP